MPLITMRQNLFGLDRIRSSFEDREMLEDISLFPIPGAVSFPHSVRTFHIFEPRYRAMIKNSIEKNRRIGVTHTKGLKKTNSNHEHFDPHIIFSAGFPEILETLPDGRMLIQIKMDKRYKIESEIQEIPFKVVLCQTYEDHIEQLENETLILREKIDLNLADILGEQNNEYRKYIQSEEWKSLSLDEYSFALFSIIIFEADIYQQVLEMQSIHQRISFLHDTLFTKIIQ